MPRFADAEATPQPSAATPFFHAAAHAADAAAAMLPRRRAALMLITSMLLVAMSDYATLVAAAYCSLRCRKR